MYSDNTRYSDNIFYVNDDKRKIHLDRVFELNKKEEIPCLHDSCQSCFGTGIKLDGSMCTHSLCCNCPKCVPYSM